MARPTFRRNPPVKAAPKPKVEADPKPKRKRKAKQDDE